MDDITLAQWNLLEGADSEDRICLRGEHLWIDGIYISPWDCPECLRRDTSRCIGCSFFDPMLCRLRFDPEVRCDLKSILDDIRERMDAVRIEQGQFSIALSVELRAHGRPLHYTVLAQMMSDRHPALRVTESRVYKTLACFPEIFEKIDEGVYQLKAT
jgi:hypothetical protein